MTKIPWISLKFCEFWSEFQQNHSKSCKILEFPKILNEQGSEFCINCHCPSWKSWNLQVPNLVSSIGRGGVDILWNSPVLARGRGNKNRFHKGIPKVVEKVCRGMKKSLRYKRTWCLLHITIPAVISFLSKQLITSSSNDADRKEVHVDPLERTNNVMPSWSSSWSLIITVFKVLNERILRLILS